MKFNINDNVRVQLTDEGRQILCENHKTLAAAVKLHGGTLQPLVIEEDDEGWSKWQLWVLMQHFGPFMHSGNPTPPFEMVIEITDDGTVQPQVSSFG